ncbi:hypothetical protein DFH07DRAFT_774471 [Mycena maculata]|uniref:Uncharacterized protein n=1 Tax=Mycena maculata TaxID=230809 RepID=A0AAD7NAI2_9AGAR|nr:hypothetical protein DFH07DRAFT_774471 [Mycena maculata]
MNDQYSSPPAGCRMILKCERSAAEVESEEGGRRLRMNSNEWTLENHVNAPHPPVGTRSFSRNLVTPPRDVLPRLFFSLLRACPVRITWSMARLALQILIFRRLRTMHCRGDGCTSQGTCSRFSDPNFGNPGLEEIMSASAHLAREGGGCSIKLFPFLFSLFSAATWAEVHTRTASHKPPVGFCIRGFRAHEGKARPWVQDSCAVLVLIGASATARGLDPIESSLEKIWKRDSYPRAPSTCGLLDASPHVRHAFESHADMYLDSGPIRRVISIVFRTISRAAFNLTFTLPRSNIHDTECRSASAASHIVQMEVSASKPRLSITCWIQNPENMTARLAFLLTLTPIAILNAKYLCGEPIKRGAGCFCGIGWKLPLQIPEDRKIRGRTQEAHGFSRGST